jgi:hypothetical protein
MPMERVSVMLKPDGFFTKNPALDEFIHGFLPLHHIPHMISTTSPALAPEDLHSKPARGVTKLLQWSARFGIVAACTNQGPTVHTYLASRFLLM